ncbi:SRPBCC family protein [Paraburkholderia unamae]|uniref:Polyketide cyclase/dehydrase/lipid transport protein n=1 Tax=Paraburkholderia unamae TaxID=219649 RepID=A0ABX5KBT3_9BURK|nr:SRPBCC family protein [Paraburkholderia unamae]PVX71620.1 polyketide cyclase/dehydrase/lipid transport protein [Paraburkholderia unamae]
MATLYRDIPVETAAEDAWAALRDPANVARVFAGVLIDVRTENELRWVTFADGTVIEERMIAVDDAHMRIAYTVVGGRFEHHHATVQVVAQTPQQCRVVWISDFKPDERASAVEPLMDAGCAALKRNLARQ